MKLFGRRIVFRIFFSESRRIKWLPAIMWGYVGKPRYTE